MAPSGSNFLNKHWLIVLDKKVEVCASTGLKADDMVIELNWMPSKNGVVIHALQNQPVIKITLRQDYIGRSEDHAIRLSEYLKQDRVVKDKGVIAMNYAGNSAFGESPL